MEENSNQIQQCVSSIIQIITAIKSVSDIPQESLQMLHKAKNGMVSTAATLAVLNHQTRHAPATCAIEQGSLVVAPRFLAQRYVRDLAIVIEVLTDDEDSPTEEGSQLSLLWTRPQSSYETSSLGSRFPFTQVQGNGAEVYLQQQALLANVRVGDSAVCLVYPSRGLWASCTVLSFDDPSCTVDVSVGASDVRGLDTEYGPFSNSSSSSSSTSGSRGEGGGDGEGGCSRVGVSTLRLPLDCSFIVPIMSASSVQSVPSSSSSSSSFCSSRSGHEEAPSDEDSDEEEDGTKANLHSHRQSEPSRRPVSFETIIGLGDWERHTKGVGGKLLMKMGYTRGSGLGKSSQGIVVPVTGLIKALPPGLSLDFLREVRQAMDGEGGGVGGADDPDSALRKRVLSSIDATVKQKKRSREEAGGGPGGQEEDRNKVTVFEFMNQMRTSDAEKRDKERQEAEKAARVKKLELQKSLKSKQSNLKALF